MASPSTASQTIGAWVANLGAKQPTPGGGAAAAVCAALGMASGAMSAVYSQRKKEVESGVAVKAQVLATNLNAAAELCVQIADEDAEAYSQLQSTWKKDCALSAEEKLAVEAQALNVPVRLVRVCHEHAASIHQFLPDCNPNIRSDAKVALHLLAGGARAAFQTVLVNNPNDELKRDLVGLIDELTQYENEVLPVMPSVPAADVAEATPSATATESS